MVMLLAYLVLIVFVAGFFWRLWVYARTPAPLKIPTTPAPLTNTGVAWRLFTEVVLFNSLFKGNKWTWVGGIAFHGALAVVLIRHIRYFYDPLPAYFAHLEIFGILAGIVMLGALGFLLVRRYWVLRTRMISSPADYGMLILLMAIAATGLLMDFAVRPDVVEIKHAMSGWISFSGFDTPKDGIFLAHFLMVLLLMLIFPFSKLMHAGGIFFSPTRNQTDNPREQKHVNPWSKY